MKVKENKRVTVAGAFPAAIFVIRSLILPNNMPVLSKNYGPGKVTLKPGCKNILNHTRVFKAA